jgi:L-ribulose-5-phosphate 4-epimerase
MQSETGLIQFELYWQRDAAPQGLLVDELVACRNRLHSMQLIGVTDEGIGYGNVSSRIAESGTFIISGTATGEKALATADDFTEVTSYDIAGNRLACRGPVRASAESLSHAAIYDAAPAINAVIHVHHIGLWQQLYRKAPTTDQSAQAGTRELALAIIELLQTDPRALAGGVVVMGGHPDGILSFGATLDVAASRLLDQLQLL